jgi:vacuolar-type H+-ATPase subunit H
MRKEQLQGALSRAAQRLQQAAKEAAAAEPELLFSLNEDFVRINELRRRIAGMTEKEFSAWLRAAPNEKAKENMLF